MHLEICQLNVRSILDYNWSLKLAGMSADTQSGLAKNPGCQKSHSEAHYQTTELTLSKQLQLMENRKSIPATFCRYSRVLPSFT